ncbi:MAG: DUF4445 domain-containing protein [Oscillospiraceae bacterium]|nr:DUF4445 domain-containing protein [Oscillospiraceae bacterium]MBQ9938885.1 DUF4445 domain-containing protein [Oscillospiraceae bacterium]
MGAVKEYSISPMGNKTIYDILRSMGEFVDAPCAGRGACGKCAVYAHGDMTPLTKEEKKVLSDEDISNGMRLSCQAVPLGECKVSLRQKSDMEEMSVLENMGDMLVELKQAISREGENIFYNGKKIAEVPADKPLIGFASDIGTTTVAVYFYDIEKGELLATRSGVNKQRAFGADVISRINCCIEDEKALKELQNAIVSQFNGFMDSFAEEFGCKTQDIICGVIVGNTTMLHLLEGLSPNGIAVAPFTPTSFFGYDIAAADIGMNILSTAPIYLAPCLSAYIGADVTAGIAVSPICNNEKPCLYIDIGTNGEMALGCKDFTVCCSTAAGPAFEGAHIKYGMSSVPGAINKVILDGDTIEVKTVGDEKPIGICGSGLIDAIAAMLKVEAIDETGRLCDDDEVEAPWDGLISDEGFAICEGVYITAQDVREVQLAKAAIAAGISTMLHYKGLKYEDIDKVYIAGGFGAHIDKRSACEIGLLPKSLVERIVFVGNAAGKGASECLLSSEVKRFTEELTAACEYIELSTDAFFRDEYIEMMMF